MKDVSYCELFALERGIRNDGKDSSGFRKIGLEVAIRIGGTLRAFAFEGRLGEDTIVEHVEKQWAYTGIYQKLNNEFCRAAGSV